MTTFIYALNDPKTGLTRYIGKANSPKTRLGNHLSRCRSPHERCHRSSWIQSLLTEGLEPILEIVKEVPVTDWRYWEKTYIHWYKTLGFDLVNGTEGGDGCPGAVRSPETRQRISDANKRRSPEMRKKISDAITAAQKGRILSPAWRQKISEGLRGHAVSFETRQKLRTRHKGRIFSPETLKRMSAGQKLRKLREKQNRN